MGDELSCSKAFRRALQLHARVALQIRERNIAAAIGTQLRFIIRSHSSLAQLAQAIGNFTVQQSKSDRNLPKLIGTPPWMWYILRDDQARGSHGKRDKLDDRSAHILIETECGPAVLRIPTADAASWLICFTIGSCGELEW